MNEIRFEEIQRKSREVFRQEAADLLSELEAALLDLEARPTDHSCIDRVFRAMHTLKGSGATSGFAEISDFLHKVEDVYNAAREDKLRLDTLAIDLTLQLCDAVQRFLSAGPSGDPAVLSAAQPQLEQLLAFLPKRSAGEAQQATAGDPVESGTGTATPRWLITFRPHADFFRSGTEPGMFLDDLRALGEARIRLLTDTLPSLANFDPESCYLAWEIELSTTAGEQAIKDVFLFASDDCDLSIEHLEPQVMQGGGKVLPGVGGAASLGVAGEAPNSGARSKSAGGETSECPRLEAPQGTPRASESQGQIRPGAPSTREMIRVPAEKLDRLVNLVGELVILRSQVGAGCSALEEVPPVLQNAAEGLLRLTTELRDLVLNVRMMPIGETFAKFHRLIRDMSHQLGKEVELEVEGADTEMDKTVLDQLNDPLVHLVRNSLDHGLEPAQERIAAGKQPRGRIRLSAEQRGDRVWVIVSDDGRGLDPSRIRAKAVAQGIIAQDAQLTEAELFQLIFFPGFSTAETVSKVSGRGVGMDVVKKRIDLLRGAVEIHSQRGKGLEIRLSLPLTLAIIEGLMVEVDGDRYILPLGCVSETIEITRSQRMQGNARNVVNVRGELVPYLRLRELFGSTSRDPELERVVLVEVDDKRLGLVVDQVLGNHQTVLKSLGWLSHKVQVFSGATVLGDGRVALIVDLPGLLAHHQSRQSTSSGFEV